MVARGTHNSLPSPQRCRIYVRSLSILLLAVIIMTLSACGGGSRGDSQQSGTLSGNWQFSMTNPDSTAPAGTLYGLQGGFLIQKNGMVTGQAVYSISGRTGPNGDWAVCDSGSATIAGTVSGQTVSLAAVAGTQTFALVGMLSSDGTITTPTFTTPGGTVAVSGNPVTCGAPTPQGGLSWSAVSVPPLTGSITGNFHSTSIIGDSGLANQDFQVTGVFAQGENVGASNATVTGSLSFINPTTLLSTYPCIPLGTVFVNGQISGNSVILQLIGADGSNDGQIGAPAGTGAATVGTFPVTLNSTASGYVLQAINAPDKPAYVVNTKSCFNGSSSNNEDSGNICLSLNSASACQQPITLSPAALIFPPQLLGSTPTIQTLTMTNNSGSPLSGMSLTWGAPNGASGFGQTDFSGMPNFTEADDCVPGGEVVPPNETGSTFTLPYPGSCTITASFSPQASCTWLPGANGEGTAPVQCPLTLTAPLTVNSPASADNNTLFTVPIIGTGVSFVQPSTPELDFGAEAIGESSLPQLLTFTNNSANPVQILGLGNEACNIPLQSSALSRSPQDTSQIRGLQVVTGDELSFAGNPLTMNYVCDLDPMTDHPNFQISSDSCSGVDLASQASCSVQVAFGPQPKTNLSGHGAGLDYYLELNTVQCYPVGPFGTPPTPAGCEIDSGRFPVELKANLPSPLRMSPGAGLSFGGVAVGKSSDAQAVTLFNDPTDPNAGTVTFFSKVGVSGSYSETDDCPFNLAPGSSCTLVVTFEPSAGGYNPGTLTINYTTSSSSSPQTQTVHLRGTGQ